VSFCAVIRCEVLLRKVSESVVPMSTNDVQLNRVIPRSKSAECSLDDGSHVTRRPTTPITYTNLFNWRRGKPEVYVINDDSRELPAYSGEIPAQQGVSREVRRSNSSVSKRSNGQVRGKMATSDQTLTLLEQTSSAATRKILTYILF